MLDLEQRRSWQARCHEILGAVVQVEADVDLTLALANAQSIESVERLYLSVFPRLGIDVKRSQLVELLNSTSVPGTDVPAVVYLPFCDPGLKRLVTMRNHIAHAQVDDHVSTDQKLTLSGRNRGKRVTSTYKEQDFDTARALISAVRQDLDSLAGWAAVPSVYGEVYAFDEGAA